VHDGWSRWWHTCHQRPAGRSRSCRRHADRPPCSLPCTGLPFVARSCHASAMLLPCFCHAPAMLLPCMCSAGALLLQAAVPRELIGGSTRACDPHTLKDVGQNVSPHAVVTVHPGHDSATIATLYRHHTAIDSAIDSATIPPSIAPQYCHHDGHAVSTASGRAAGRKLACHCARVTGSNCVSCPSRIRR